MDLEKANALLSDGRAEEALGLYEEAVRKSPEDERGHCGAVVSLVAAGRPAEAVPYLEALIRLLPGAAYPHGMMGSVMELAGKSGEAVACFDRMIEIDPDEMFGRLRKAVVLIEMGRTGRADECMEELAAIEPRSAPAARDKARIAAIVEYDGPEDGGGFNPELMPGLTTMWDILVSEDAQRRALPAAVFAGGEPEPLPESLDLDRAEAMALAKRGRYEEAADLMDGVLRARPGGVADLGVAGMLLERLGRATEAVACYERAIEAEPGEMMAYHLKCGALAARGDAKGAAECYRAALGAAPSDANGAVIQADMRAEYGELLRCAQRAGSERRGLAAFMKKRGVGARPAWGRRPARGRRAKRAGL